MKRCNAPDLDAAELDLNRAALAQWLISQYSAFDKAVFIHTLFTGDKDKCAGLLEILREHHERRFIEKILADCAPYAQCLQLAEGIDEACIADLGAKLSDLPASDTETVTDIRRMVTSILIRRFPALDESIREQLLPAEPSTAVPRWAQWLGLA